MRVSEGIQGLIRALINWGGPLPHPPRIRNEGRQITRMIGTLGTQFKLECIPVSLGLSDLY